MNINKKVIKYLALVCLAMWLIVAAVFKEQINGFVYTFKPIATDGTVIVNYDSHDQNIDFELAPGKTLVLPINLETRLSRMGIYLGKQEDSSDQYVFQLEDGYGNVLGKTVTALSDMKENDFLYVRSGSLVDNTATYYIRIFSDDTNTDHQPLKIKVSLASEFETAPFSVSEEESEYTLILDRRYHAVGEKATKLISLVLVVITAAIWLVDTNLKEIINKKFLHVCKENIPWRHVVAVAIGLFLAADLLLPFFPKAEYIMQNGNRSDLNTDIQVLPLNEGVVAEQYVEIDSVDFDSLGFQFATYMQVIKNGVVHIEALDADDGGLIFSERIKTEKIADNRYQYVQIPEPESFYGKNILLRIWAEYTVESTPVALYYNENSSPSMYAIVDGELQNSSLFFAFSTQIKTFRTEEAVIITAVLISLIIVYVYKFVQFHKIWHKYFICVPFAAVLLLWPSLSLLYYGEISLNGITALFSDQSKWAVSKTFEEAELKEYFSVENYYNLAGVRCEAYERTEIPIDGNLSNVSLHFPGDTMRKLGYVIRIYWDTGNGYNDKQSYAYSYIHRGANTVSFYVPCNEIVGNVMISVGATYDRAMGRGIPDEIFPFKRVEINSQPSTSWLFSGQTLLLFASIIGLLTMGCLWKHFQTDAKPTKKIWKINVSISFIFIIIAVIYGVACSFLMATYQIPDEGAHQKMLFMNMGDTSLAGRISNAIGDQGQADVIGQKGQIIDLEAYLNASTNRLDDYSLHGIPSIRVLQRPGQTIGVLLGMLLHLPAYWILQLGELGGLAVYIAMGALTLRIIPFKKNVMMMIMLLPIAIQEAGSLSYDSFTNALSFFTVAYILYLKVEAKKVSWRQVAILFLLAVGLLVGKFIYVLLLGLVLTIPLSKLELKFGRVTITGEWVKTHKWYTTGILIILGCVGFASVWFIFNGSDYFMLASTFVIQFPQLVRLIAVSVIVHWRLWLEGSIAIFGYYHVTVNYVFIWLVVVSLFVCTFIHHEKADAQERTGICCKKKIFSTYDLLIWYGLFSVLFVVVCMTMITWGIYIWQIKADLPYAVKMRVLPRIEGVQGRYFLPIMPLIFIPMYTKRDIFKGFPVGFCRICYYLFVITYTISLLLAIYWGVG